MANDYTIVHHTSAWIIIRSKISCHSQLIRNIYKKCIDSNNQHVFNTFDTFLSNFFILFLQKKKKTKQTKSWHFRQAYTYTRIRKHADSHYAKQTFSPQQTNDKIKTRQFQRERKRKKNNKQSSARTNSQDIQNKISEVLHYFIWAEGNIVSQW